MLRDLTQLVKTEHDTIDIFGLILYSDSDANIKKVINDKDYWQSFNNISGIRWGIFAIKLKIGTYEIPDSDDKYMHFITTVWVEPETNKRILKEFGIENSKDLPLFVIYTYDENQDIIWLNLKLNDTSVETAYNSIKESISLMTESINKIHSESLNNTFEIFQILRTKLYNHKEMKLIKKGIKYLPWLGNLFKKS